MKVFLISFMIKGWKSHIFYWKWILCFLQQKVGMWNGTPIYLWYAVPAWEWENEEILIFCWKRQLKLFSSHLPIHHCVEHTVQLSIRFCRRQNWSEKCIGLTEIARHHLCSRWKTMLPLLLTLNFRICGLSTYLSCSPYIAVVPEMG